MPELPEVEVLVRHLSPLLKNKTVRGLDVRRAKVLAPTTVTQLKSAVIGARFSGLARRGKYLVFELQQRSRRGSVFLLGHLGMTGRVYLARRGDPLPKHAAVVIDLGRQTLIFEDTRYFGRLTLDMTPLAKLGPEPLSPKFTPAYLAAKLKRSSQAIKVKLLDQSLVAGIGNIYASEALFRAGISPRLVARGLRPEQVRRLWRAIRQVLREAIRCGSTVPLSFSRRGKRDGLFYFGRAPNTSDYYAERLQVYGREGEACQVCGTRIRRAIQASRSTFYCPRCQRGPASRMRRKCRGKTS